MSPTSLSQPVSGVASLLLAQHAVVATTVSSASFVDGQAPASDPPLAAVAAMRP